MTCAPPSPCCFCLFSSVLPLFSFSLRSLPIWSHPDLSSPLLYPIPAHSMLELTLPPFSQALCAAVTTTDLAETQALLGCGAGVSCFSGDPQAPTPLALAEQAGQTLQMEFLRNNQSTGEWLMGQFSLSDPPADRD